MIEYKTATRRRQGEIINEIFKLYIPKIFKQLQNVPQHDLDICHQHARYKIIDALDRYDPEKAAATTYLFFWLKGVRKSYTLENLMFRKIHGSIDYEEYAENKGFDNEDIADIQMDAGKILDGDELYVFNKIYSGDGPQNLIYNIGYNRYCAARSGLARKLKNYYNGSL